MKRLKADTFMYINKDTLDVTDKDDPNSIEFIHFFLKGQAFLYNQIRKMVGLIIQVFRGNLEDEFIANAFTDNFVNVCLAPGMACYWNRSAMTTTITIMIIKRAKLCSDT